ncbi:protein boule-like [Hydractinia symbiolongicarpus]|uniref:protein boule-like n=1 Tax=Hydractinia symbiolongicarpus TaxID=13093 RepID=UPI00254EC20D|nr:protein boule-like [Hydractinia symbiolongicarpus]
MSSAEEKTTVKNFKNLRISIDEHTQEGDEVNKEAACMCSHYFNMDRETEHLVSCNNSPTTVKSTSPDACIYGTHYPNRIFVGHLPGKASATDLADFFRSFGTVLEGKVVLDSFGRSRRFGFVTFATHEDVQNVLSQGSIFFKGKKINVGPAVKKMFGTDFSPPESPAATTSGSSTPTSPESLTEKIITVPPVNENKGDEDPASPRAGNVWLKINTKPKQIAKPVAEAAQAYSPNMIYTQQPTTYQPYIYPTVLTVPYNQSYNYPRYYYTPTVYPTNCAQQMVPFQQWPQTMYYTMDRMAMMKN